LIVDLGDDGGRVIEEFQILGEPGLPNHQVVMVFLELGDAGSE
jgi:hypothetical protein